MGLSEIVRDIRTSTYQICRMWGKLIRLTTFNKYMCNWTLEVRDILKNIVEKRRNCSLGAISPLFHNIFYTLLDFHVKAGTRYSLRDKRLFEISEVEITRVNCILKILFFRSTWNGCLRCFSKNQSKQDYLSFQVCYCIKRIATVRECRRNRVCPNTSLSSYIA